MLDQVEGYQLKLA
jgi:hypothetical protein